MRRRDAVEIFARLRTDQLVVGSVGKGSAHLFSVHHDDATLYNLQMPYTTALGLGLAMALPNQGVVVLDGDGSLLSGIGVLTTVARASPPNLTIVVWDNEAYASIGGLPTATAGATDLEVMARGAGLQNTATVRDLKTFEETVRNALGAHAPWFVVAKVEAERIEGESEVTDMLRPYPFDLTENAMLFRHALRKRGLVSGWHGAASWPVSFD